jgi:hypothetical protein
MMQERRYRMAGTRHLLAIAMTFLLAGISRSGKPEVVGIVVQADHAKLGSSAASDGTTVYDGDRLSTETGGTLRLRSGGVMLYLADESSVIVRNGASAAAKEFEAELVKGAVVVSAAAGTGAEVVARSARIRPEANTAGVIQVRVLGEKELVIFARRGSGQFTYRDETETIPEGKTYRVLLDPADGGASTGQSAKKAGHAGKAFVLIAIAVAAGISIPLALRQQQYESPDRP